MARTKKRAVYVATESTFSTDPSTDGSGYLHVPAFDIGMLSDGKSQLETNYMTGRSHPTAPIVGQDGWSFDLTMPLCGLAAACGASTVPSSTEDVYGTFWKHTLGTVTQITGRAVTSMASVTAITFASDLYNLQDMLCLFEAALPSASAVRSQWSMVTVDPASGSYTIAPALSTQCTSAAVAYGYSNYIWTSTSPATLSFVYAQDGTNYLLSGGRCVSMSIEMEAGQKAMVKMSFSGNSKTVDVGKSALPTATVSPVTPIKGMLSPVWVGGTKYATKKISIDMGLAAAVQDSTEATEARADYELMNIAPKITIEPLFTTALQDLKRSATIGNAMLIQCGSGVVSSGVLNSVAFQFNEVVATEANPVDDQGRIRLGMTFMATDKGIFSGSTLARFMQVARA